MRTHCLLFVALLSSVYAERNKKPLPYNHTQPGPKFDNPNYIRDRYKNEINKPMMPVGYGHRKDPFHPAWMDYCDPYHCNDYHKVACGLNRKSLRFKWFQSACHIILNNKCATFRGNLKYDMVDVKFCYIYVMYLRLGCQECEHEGGMVCGVSLVDNHVALFRDRCALEKANCEAESFHEYEEVRISLCAHYLDLDIKKLE